MDDFLEAKMKSYLCELLLANNNCYVKNFNGCEEHSIAHIAYLDGYLDDLDGILRHFFIKELATNDFKNRLRENWIEENKDKRRNDKANGVYSAIYELIVADYFTRHGENIVNLSAWDGNCQSDVVSTIAMKKYFTEVKFLGEIPEVQSMNNCAIRNNPPQARWIGSLGEFYSYLVTRIASASMQLQTKEIPCGARRVFIVVKSSFCKWLHLAKDDLCNKADWPMNGLNNLRDKGQQIEPYRAQNVENWLKQANKVMIAVPSRNITQLEIVCQL